MTRRHLLSSGLCLLSCLALGGGLTRTAAQSSVAQSSPSSAADRHRDGYPDAA
ncbi:hypothetical protein [Deinococcus saxicola]|uniref:hypothetical protein n=1 Tax=Deinococcus saxicola TaxID=249406 RepID=UPI0039EE4583